MLACGALTAAAATAALRLQVPAVTSIAPEDVRLQYTGRFDARRKGVRRFSWPASQISCAFTGTSIAANLSSSGPGDRFLAIVDGSPAKYVMVGGAAGVHTLASGLADAAHTLTLWKVSESVMRGVANTGAAFYGFSLPTGGSFAAPPPRPSRRLEFVGDSDTSGWCADGAAEDDAGVKYQNTYEMWGAQVARALGAEIHVQAVTGIGVETRVSGGAIGDFLDDVENVGEARAWDYARWIPDAVVLLIGPNDRAFDDAFVAAYVRLMAHVARNYAAAAAKPAIVSVCGGSANGLDACPAIRRAHRQFAPPPGFAPPIYAEITTGHWAQINADGGGSEFNGCDSHYNAKGHAVLAGDVLPVIRQALGW